ncbi:MAG: Stp1/IreP family PP2C-type Ser/Thr phosphatase [Actinomycetota bacterium]|nr:Stp1/IreP family PP2C-type Ser/Thr phosphatase [Actinomycetota bacterium]
MTDTPHTPALAWGAATDTGRVRTENEDAFVADKMVFGVADGMGGHQAGEVASAIAASTLRERLGNGAPSVDVAVATVVEANAAIFQGAHSNAEQRGMVTTLTAMEVLSDGIGAQRLAVLNVGDSRTYVTRGGRLRRVTVDHSYVQELVSTGHITEAEARTHPRRNIVTRALGIEPNVRVDTLVLSMVRGDRYVLCSDGLVDEVDDDEIMAVLATNPGPQSAAEALVAAANANGGRDNVTVVVVDVLEGAEPPADHDDLDVEPAWDDDEQPDRLIDAEAGLPQLAARTAGAAPALGGAAIPPGQTTQELPIIGGKVRPAGARTRGFGLGSLLFLLGLGVIVTLAVTLVLVVRHNSDDTPPPTTVPVTTVATSTTVRTTTTVRSTTSVGTAPTTSAAGTG